MGGSSRNLIAFYKLNNNSFPLQEWEPSKCCDYYRFYQLSLGRKISARNAENARSYVIDNIIDILRDYKTSNGSTLLHRWELASLSRRQRAGWLADRLDDAIKKMSAGKTRRHFAFFNQVTGCWLVFFFRYGGFRESFPDELIELTKNKLFVEIKNEGFKYSVFGFGFRKSVVETGNTVDDLVLCIEDAEDYPAVSDEQYQTARKFFGKYTRQNIKEFPG